MYVYIYIHAYNPLYNPIGDIPSEDRHHVGSVQNPVGSPDKIDWLVEGGIPQLMMTIFPNLYQYIG